MVTAWGMQTLMSSANIMHESKGIPVRCRLRTIFDQHVKGKEVKHILAGQIEQVEKILAIKDIPAAGSEPKAKKPKTK